MTEEKQEPSIYDVKGVVALAVFVLYIILSVAGWGGFGFSISSVMVLITFFIALFGGIRAKEKKKKDDEDEPDMGGIVCFFIWLGFFIVRSANIWPDWSGRFMYLMFAAAISTSMKPKDIFLFLGLSILTAFFFESGVLATMVLIVTALFAYACRENPVFGAIMMVPLLAVGWFVGSGYGTMAVQKVDSLNTQLGATTGISTDGVGNKISVMLNNTWLLLTNPNKWYEMNDATKGNRDEGSTSMALEITKIEALPTTVMPLDTFDIMFELENKGTKPATNVKIGAMGNTLADACGKVGGLYCSPQCMANDAGVIDTSSSVPTCDNMRDLNKIAPIEKRFDSFGFQAPECPGTYTVSAAVSYDYVVDATLNLQTISREYYNELLRNDQMKWVDELSTASAGPFKMTLRTDRQQPIPDRNSQGTQQVFKVYLGLMNEHVGRASMDSAIIEIPSDLELVAWDETANKVDEACSITYDVALGGDVATKTPGTYLNWANSGVKTKEEYDKLITLYKEESLAQTINKGYVRYRTLDVEKRKMEQNEWRYYKCNFRLAEGTKIEQIKTYFIKASLPYTFEYEKSTSVNVKSPVTIAPKCKKDVKQISAISTAQTVPQTKDAVVKAIAQELFYCYNKYANWLYETDAKCGNFKLYFDTCTDTITAGDIYSALDNTMYRAAFGRIITANDVKINDNAGSGAVLFENKNITFINVAFNAPLSTINSISVSVDSSTENPKCAALTAPVTP